MYKEIFKKLELDEVTAILGELNPEFDGAAFDPAETTILSQNLPFYPGFQLLDIADYASMPAMRRFVLYSKDMFLILDFSNEAIYTLNQKLPISLNKDNVADYVRFFFTYVRGRHGRFIITESVDDINWKEEPPPTARKAIGKMLYPVKLEKIEEENYYLNASMIFKDSLFRSSIKVEPNGFISLSDEELLIEDIPVLDDTFGQ